MSIQRLFTRNSRGQVLPIIAMSMPVLIGLLILVIAGGFLVSQRIALDSAAESAALSVASDINAQAYYQSGTIVIGNDVDRSSSTDTDSDSSSPLSTAGFDADDQPNIDPCDTAATGGTSGGQAVYNPLLCAIQTVLCTDYNSNATALANCLTPPVPTSSGNPNPCSPPTLPTTYPLPPPPPSPYAAAIYVCNRNAPPTSDQLYYAPNQTMITYFLSQPSSNQLEVEAWYTYPNPLGSPLGGIFPNQLTESTSQFASPAVTPCTNGATSC